LINAPGLCAPIRTQSMFLVAE